MGGLADHEISSIALSEAAEVAIEQPFLVLAAEDMRRALVEVRAKVLARSSATDVILLIDGALGKVERRP